MDYTFSVGTGDPLGFSAMDDAEAIRTAAAYARDHFGASLRSNPQAVATLLGPGGLLTRPSERVDEFVERLTGVNPVTHADTLQPGDVNTPDCNGD